VAAWPLAWQGQNLRDILVTMGYDVDIPWRELPKKQRDWILFTEETPPCRCTPVSPRANPRRAQAQAGTELPGHLHRRAALHPAHLHPHAERADEKRVSQFMLGSPCPLCEGKRLTGRRCR
jgi:excinuclease ABC subunit A